MSYIETDDMGTKVVDTQYLQHEIQRLRAENEALRKDAEWIGVDDELPEMEESVICYCRIHGRFLGYRKQIPGTRSEFTWANFEGESGLLPPTHWRPLPPAPDRAMKG